MRICLINKIDMDWSFELIEMTTSFNFVSLEKYETHYLTYKSGGVTLILALICMKGILIFRLDFWNDKVLRPSNSSASLEKYETHHWSYKVVDLIWFLVLIWHPTNNFNRIKY